MCASPENSEQALREQIAADIEAKLRPLTDKTKWDDGYDCCGCSTYDYIIDDAVAVVLGTYEKVSYDDRK